MLLCVCAFCGSCLPRSWLLWAFVFVALSALAHLLIIYFSPSFPYLQVMSRPLQNSMLLGLSFLLLLLSGFPLIAQETKKNNSIDSPVFRSYRPPPEAPPVQESDALRQIWFAFLAARKANAGDAKAQQELAVRHLYGKGVERDTVKAAYWMQKAADQGMITAKFDVAILAFHGWGMPWDPFLSYRYLLEACGTRHAGSRTILSPDPYGGPGRSSRLDQGLHMDEKGGGCRIQAGQGCLARFRREKSRS